MIQPMPKDKPPEKLKPVIMENSAPGSKHDQNTTQQALLLKAMQVTNDPDKLRQMIHARTVADVYRTLDKLAIRKEFHEALDRAGISFDFIVSGIKDIAATAEKPADRLKALQTLLQTLGLDKYEQESSSGGGSWEDQLLRAIEANPKVEQLAAGVVPEYDVKHPVLPDSVKAMRKNEAQITNTLYKDEKPHA